MGINIWIIFASILLVSARARRYDHGPHNLYDFSTGLATTGPYGHRELILYLTPDQVRSLEADGAVVKSDKDDENNSELSAEQQSNEEQDEENDDAQADEEEEENGDSQEEEENDESQEEEETDDSQAEDAQQEEESSEEKRTPKIDFETILRLLNEEQVDEETAEEQPSENPEIEAEVSEESRSISPRFKFHRQQQKNVAIAAAKNEELFKTYSNIRYQPQSSHGWRQRFNYQHHQQTYDSKTPEEFDEKLIGTPLQGTKKYKLVPYKIEEPIDEPAPIVNAQQPNLETEDEVQSAKTNTLLRAALLKYANRVQKLKNSEKTKAEAKATSKGTEGPILIKQQQSRKQSKIGKARSVGNKQTKPQQPKSIAIPVMMPERSAVQKSIKVPVEPSKIVRNKNNVATRKVTANKKTKPRRSSKEQS